MAESVEATLAARRPRPAAPTRPRAPREAPTKAGPRPARRKAQKALADPQATGSAPDPAETVAGVSAALATNGDGLLRPTPLALEIGAAFDAAVDIMRA